MPAPIDRQALVTRHHVHVTRYDPASPLSVGNGEFAFTVDLTGLQTFPGETAAHWPLMTMAQWGWHSFPNPHGYTTDEVLSTVDVAGRAVPYAGSKSAMESPAGKWLRANPHRLSLGRIGLLLRHADGRDASIDEMAETQQSLVLRSGRIDSRFRFDDQPFTVSTACHPTLDAVAVRVESPLLRGGRAGVRIGFAYPTGTFGPAAEDWNRPEAHATRVTAARDGATFERRLDDTVYHVRARWTDGGVLTPAGPHVHELRSPARDTLELVCSFSPQASTAPLPTATEVFAAAADHWQRFWSTGGAVDLSGSTDPRAAELERRIVLSQYQTAINCAGSLPPQETGLVTNSWFGKYHLEMHWWHAAHFALWGRAHLLERGLGWYAGILPAATDAARRQGYAGARWPKMTAPDGRSSPSSVGEFLVWQQPHPIFLAELCYRSRPTRETLARYRDVVMASAEFMASYARWDESTSRYVLGPGLIPSQECYKATETLNPTFELVYWHWALGVAQAWRMRLGLEPHPQWAHVVAHLARPHVRDGAYAAVETEPFTRHHDHPSMTAALGVLPPTPLIAPAIMSRTVDDAIAKWDWPTTWGWDYPMLAMTAARLGRPGDAVDFLLMDAPKNRYLGNGHNYQRENLPLYLPGNGGLLYAIAMMAGGWDGGPSAAVPGFPRDGTWNVRAEGIQPAP
jgi:hypothetical protein